MKVTKEQYEKTKKIIEASLKSNAEEKFKTFCSLFECDKYFEINKVNFEFDEADIARNSWARIARDSNTIETNKKVYNSVIKLMELNHEKRKLENQLNDFKTIRICNHIKNRICIIHQNLLHCEKCCLKKELYKKGLIFLCPYPCAKIKKEKPKHNCLKCGKQYYPLFFWENEGWVGGVLAQTKLEQIELSNKLLYKNKKTNF